MGRLALDIACHICHHIVVFNSETEIRMALSAHLQELSEKHRQLERRIEEEAARPGSDDTTIRKMKREKLKLKDEINRLELNTRH
ncbi:MAG: DUF465 domain-containing protein [Hyphomicrobium sp.]|jgi:hypothetical protein